MAVFPAHPETVGNSAPAPGSPGGWWLVKTGTGSSEVQPYSPGLEPQQAKTGTAVYLGTTVQQIGQRITQAARELGVPDPQNVPSLPTTAGILGAEFAGAIGGIAGAASAADAAAAAATETAATSTGATGATAGATTGGAASKLLSSTSAKVAGSGLAGLLGLTGTWPQLLVRALEALAGIALLLLGLQALTGTGQQGNPAAYVRKVIK